VYGVANRHRLEYLRCRSRHIPCEWSAKGKAKSCLACIKQKVKCTMEAEIEVVDSEESKYEEWPKKKAKKNDMGESRVAEVMERMVAEMAHGRKVQQAVVRELQMVHDALGVLAYMLDREYEEEEMPDVEYEEDNGIPTLEEEMEDLEMEMEDGEGQAE